MARVRCTFTRDWNDDDGGIISVTSGTVVDIEESIARRLANERYLIITPGASNPTPLSPGAAGSAANTPAAYTTAGDVPITAAALGNASMVRVYNAGSTVLPVTIDASLLSSGRAIAFAPAIPGQTGFYLVPHTNITAPNWVVEGGATVSSNEAVSNTVYLGCFEDGKARVLSASTASGANRVRRSKKWAVARGRALNGIANARVAIVGDSTCSGLLIAATGLAKNSFSAAMARVLSGAGHYVNHNAAFGDTTRLGGTTFTTYDPRWATPGAWAARDGFATLGGSSFVNSTTTETLSFTPRDPVTGALFVFDTYDIYTADNSGYGTWTTNVDGGATLATVNNNAAQALRKTTVACTSGTHTINIQRTGAGGQIYVIGICPSLSTKKGVEIYNVAGGGFTSTDLATSYGLGFTYPPALAQLAPDLTVISIGINDRHAGLYTSAFAANLQSVITIAKATGDCIVAVPIPSGTAYSAFTTQANQDAFNDATLSVAMANDCPIWDMRKLFVSYAAGNPLGYYSDMIHPSAGAYGSLGEDLAKMLEL